MAKKSQQQKLTITAYLLKKSGSVFGLILILTISNTKNNMNYQ